MKIKDLTKKILGGITWLLTGSFCDVDIEFKDEMNLVEKM